MNWISQKRVSFSLSFVRRSIPLIRPLDQLCGLVIYSLDPSLDQEVQHLLDEAKQTARGLGWTSHAVNAKHLRLRFTSEGAPYVPLQRLHCGPSDGLGKLLQRGLFDRCKTDIIIPS